jgi:hypothetical protein
MGTRNQRGRLRWGAGRPLNHGRVRKPGGVYESSTWFAGPAQHYNSVWGEHGYAKT